MQNLKIFATMLSLGLLFAAFVPIAKADAGNKLTVVTFAQPVEIPGKVLAPGQYVFRLLDPNQSLTEVEVLDAKNHKAIEIFQAIPDYRFEPTNNAQFVLAPTTKNAPERVKVWWYPGDSMGLEPVYPNHK
jgi:hypothetical protein